MDLNGVIEKLKSTCGADSIEDFKADMEPPTIIVKKSSFRKIMECLINTSCCDFNVLQNISAVDFLPEIKKPPPQLPPKEGEPPKPPPPPPEEIPGRMEMVYHLWSISNDLDLAVKVIMDRENPEIESVTDLWKGANWHEREAWDLMGVKVSGHPDMRRILCPEDWEGHPLKKDYKVQESWHGMVIEPRSKMNPWMRNLP